MPQDRRHDGLSEPLGDPLIAAIEDALTLATFSFARPRRHDALLRTHAVPVSWAAWQTQPALYALLDRIARSRTARPSHLAAALGLSRSTVSYQLRRLEERQLIYRNDFAVPRWRGKVKPIFAPTVQGYNALRQLRGVRRAAVAVAIRDWSDHDKIDLARLLRRLAADCGPPADRSAHGEEPALRERRSPRVPA
jgi:DNA-binding MarR family transcriptional regulator